MSKSSANPTYVVVIFRKGLNLPFVISRKTFCSVGEALSFCEGLISMFSPSDELYIAERCIMKNCIGYLNIVSPCAIVR